MRAFTHEPGKRCETTHTRRYPTVCGCDTYHNNLGPCLDWEEGANGRCVYCDHEYTCHAAILGKFMDYVTTFGNGIGGRTS